MRRKREKRKSEKKKEKAKKNSRRGAINPPIGCSLSAYPANQNLHTLPIHLSPLHREGRQAPWSLPVVV
jgi:hypothetical protein